MNRSYVIAGAALTAAGVLGGGVALGGAALAGSLGGGTTTTIEQSAPAASEPAVQRSSPGLTVHEIYERSAPGVVQITSRTAPKTQTDPFGFQTQSPAQEALGSGFVIDKAGHIVTNDHIVEGAQQVEVSFSDQDSYKAKIVGTDPSTDLAVLQVDVSSRALTPLQLGDSDAVEVGDPVVAIGNPFGLDSTVTSGIVSALQRLITAPNGFTIDHVIQTDAPINQGNSGGPLLNALGEVIGVNSQIQSTSGGNVGIGFAVPSNTVKTVVAQILRTGKVEHAYLGVKLQEIGPDLARVVRLPVDRGLLVESVEKGGAAARAGIRGGDTPVVVAGTDYRLGGDLIVAAGGTRVTSIDQLRDVLAKHKPGDKIELELYRGSDKRSVTVTLGRQPSSPQG